MTENDANPPINNDSMEKKKEMNLSITPRIYAHFEL